MGRTAPAPNVPAPPGMAPGTAVKAGGGSGGGGSGRGAGSGGGGSGGGPGGGGDGAGDGGPAAGAGSSDAERYKPCGTKSCPIDVATGRMYTLPDTDLHLPGLIDLAFDRMYSSYASHRDVGLGFGWVHSYAWEVQTTPTRTRVWTATGTWEDFPPLEVGQTEQGKFGWILSRVEDGYVLDTNELLWRKFVDVGGRHRLAEVWDRNKNHISLRYDGDALSEITDSVGREIRTRPDAQGRLSCLRVLLPDGSHVDFARYEYDADGNLTRVVDADGHACEFAYAKDHLMVRNGYRNGLAFHFRYDRKKRCFASWGSYPGRVDPSLDRDVPKVLADGVTPARGVHQVKISYLPDGYREVVDSTRIEHYVCNEHGLLDLADLGGAVHTATFRDDGWVMTATDALGHTTTYERDTRGNVTRQVNAAGNATSYEYNSLSQLVRSIDPLGGELTIEYDRWGNPVVASDEAKQATVYAYDNRGLCLVMTEYDGARTEFRWDDHGNLVEVQEANGATWRYDYDFFSRTVSRTGPMGNVTRYSYSPLGNPISVTASDGSLTNFEYDGEGNLLTYRESGGAVTRYEYGGFHKLCAVHSPNGTTERLTYDREGNLVRFINERGHEAVLGYDANRNLVSARAFSGRELNYRYNLNGRMTHVTDRVSGETTELVFDEIAQNTEVIYDDGSSESFDYDVCGRLVKATVGGVVVGMAVDARGLVVRETQTIASDSIETTLRHDHRRDVVERGSSLGYQERIIRDAVGERTTTALDDGSEIRHIHNPRGEEIARELPGGATIKSDIDALSALMRRRVTIGATLSQPSVDLHFRYDTSGELVERRDDRLGVTTYKYDAVGQLLEALPANTPKQLFTYDATGNAHDGSSTSSRQYDAGDRLVRDGRTHYEYDSGDRLTCKRVAGDDGAPQQWSYEWTARGQLARVVRPDGSSLDFRYDALGRRVLKTLLTPGGKSQASTRFVWSRSDLLHELRTDYADDGDASTLTSHVPSEAGYEPVAHRVQRVGQGDAPWRFHVVDCSGMPARTIDDAGQVTATYQSDAWGLFTITAADATAVTPFRFEGHYSDEETGLFYTRFRYFDPAVGRFISPDPLELAAATNAFAYGINPIGWIDCLGIDWNYRLRDEKDNVYYHGRASDKTTPGQVMARHSKTKGKDKDDNEEVRFGKGDSLEVVTEGIKKKEAMGVEHAGIAKGGTHTCPRKKKGEKKEALPVRGNCDKGISEKGLKTKGKKGDKYRDRKKAGEDFLDGRDPNTMPAKSKWKREGSRAVEQKGEQ